ncbi:hypothetical protein [Shewanella colwelliana]|uniref:hypothetical protein n=1 Tax=Shewanella colwelliana TaxID=23 RepID=UPI00048E78CB|nr:hypothetical protein [Shewanella colwelliana]
MNVDSELSRFNIETLKNALNNAFPEELTDYHSCIADEIINLIEVLSHRYQRDFPELTTIKFLAKKKVKNTQADLEAHKNNLSFLYQVLVKEKQLEKYYFSAFIASVMRSPSQDHQQFEQYKAITLLVCAKLYTMGRHESAIKSVCNEIRQWSLGKRNELSNNLPDVIDSEMKKLIDELDLKRKEKLEVNKSSKVGHQISNIYVPYNDSYNHNKGILRGTTLRDPGAPRTRLIINPVENDGSDTITEFIEVQTHQEGWATEEASSEHKKKMFMISMMMPNKSGYAVQKLRAQAISNKILKNHMCLPCDIQQATKFEIRTLLSYCMDPEKVCEKTRSFLLASLTLGSSLERVSQRKYDDKTNSLIQEHKLPTQNQRKRIIKLISPTKTTFFIRLPFDIKTILLNDLDDLTLKKTSKLLSYINKKHGTNLTENKISSYLRHTLKQESIDPTIIALIEGKTTKTVPELSYTHLYELDVNQIYCRFLLYLENLSSKSHKFEPNNQHAHQEKHPIGSPLVMNDEILGKFFRTLEKNISEISDRYSQQQHNFITYYVLFTLAISSGYRPVTGWFGKVTDYNLFNSTFWISDKEMHQALSGRMIILPDIAMSILKHYLRYLKAGKVDSMSLKIEVTERYQDAISGEKHLFFFINDGAIEEVTPKTMTAHFDSVLPLPLNWHRHYVRSLLVDENVPPELIAAWMGHAELNEPAFTRFCSYSINDLKIISNTINTKLVSVDCKEITFV